MDADDDIVVGDTIIFTERLYVDRDGDLLVPAGGATGGSSSSNKCNSNNHNHNYNVPNQSQSSHPFHHHDFPAAASGAGRGSAPRVSLSMASLGFDPRDSGAGATKRGEGAWTPTAGARAAREAGHGRRHPSITAPAAVQVTNCNGGGSGMGGEFVGERTAAAHVLQDSFRSMRRKERQGVLEYDRYIHTTAGGRVGPEN